jgi:hypothetical protein
VRPFKAKAPELFPIVVADVPVELIKVVPLPPEFPMVLLAVAPVPKVLVAVAPAPKELVREAPVPMVLLPLLVKVVKAPVEGVVPIAPGLAKVAPFKDEAFKFATLVVEATTKGAVLVATVEVNCPLILAVVIPLKAPEFIINPLIVLVVVAPVMAPLKPRVETPDTAPKVVTFNPLPADKAKVSPFKAKAPLKFPMVVADAPVELIKVVPKTVVAPLMALLPPEFPMVLLAVAPVPKVLVAVAPAPKELVKLAPVPMVLLPLLVKVVKAPVLGVVPMAPGLANVAPFKELAFKFATLVVEATTRGAVPVAKVEVN